MEEDFVFSSTMWRFGPWFFPQYLAVTDNGVEYCKWKLKNYIGVSPDIAMISNDKIDNVALKSHFFKGTEILISFISGRFIHLKNFTRSDAEEIQELILG